MLHVERMQIKLPAGFEHRAAAIAHLVGESMIEINTSESKTMESLAISPVQVLPTASDQEVADCITQQIISSLGNHL